MSDLVLSGLIVGVLAMLLWTPAMLSMGVSKFEGDLTVGERVLCCIPIFNVIRAEIKYYGKLHFVSISIILLLIVTVVRVIVWWNFYTNVTLGTATVIALLVAVALWLIANMLFVYNIIHDADAVRGFKLILLTVFFPFGQYYIGAYLSNVVKHMQEKEATFKL